MNKIIFRAPAAFPSAKAVHKWHWLSFAAVALLIALTQSGCGPGSTSSAAPTAPPSTHASGQARLSGTVGDTDVGKTYLAYLFGGTGLNTADFTLDKVIVGVPVVSRVREPSGYVMYGFEFTIRAVSGSTNFSMTNAFLSQSSPETGSYTSSPIDPSYVVEKPEQFKVDTDITAGSAVTGWVAFAFPPGITPVWVSFDVASLTIASIDTGNANPTWYLSASARPTPTPSQQPACTEQQPAECLLAASAVASLDTGTSIEPPAGMNLVKTDVDAAQGFAAAAFKDSTGNIIIADEDADLASPFGSATPYQNWSFAAEAEVILGKSPTSLINDAVQFVDQVRAATGSAPIYVTGFGLGGVEAEAQALNESATVPPGVAGGVTFGAPGLPGNTLVGTTDLSDNFVNFVDYGDSLGIWSSDSSGALVSLAPEFMNHYGVVDQVGDQSNAVLPMLAADTSKLSAGSLIAQDVGSDWHGGDGFDQLLRFVPDPAAVVVATYDSVLKTASYAYLAGAAVLYHSLGQYAKDLGVSLAQTVAPASSMAEFVKTYEPTATTAALQAADATTVNADGAVDAPSYALTADATAGLVSTQTYKDQDNSQYDVSYDPEEQVSSLKVNEPDGTSYEIFSDDSGQASWSTRVDFYSGPDETGTLTQTLYNWSVGDSQLQVFTSLPKGDTAEILNYSQPDATGTMISKQFK